MRHCVDSAIQQSQRLMKRPSFTETNPRVRQMPLCVDGSAMQPAGLLDPDITPHTACHPGICRCIF